MRRNSISARRELLVRGVVYGALALLVLAAAAYGNSARFVVAVRDIAYIEGRPVTLSGYGLVVGLQRTGDGCQVAHSDVTLEATLGHLGIDTHGQKITTRNVAAVLVQAELRPGFDIGVSAPVRLTALGDAVNLAGGELLPVTLNSRDGRFHEEACGTISPIGNKPLGLTPAAAVVDHAVVSSATVFMTELPSTDFVLGIHGLRTDQVRLLAERINSEFGMIANTHSGCDIEINLPASYQDLDERASLVFQIAAMPVGDIVPALLVDRQIDVDTQE